MDDAPVQPFQIALVREFFRCVIVIVIIIIIVIIIVTAFQQGGIGELQRHRNHVKLARGRRRTAIAIRLVAFLAIQTPLAAAAAASSSPETNRHPLPQPPANLTFGERTAADPEDRSFPRTLGSPIIGRRRRTTHGTRGQKLQRQRMQDEPPVGGDAIRDEEGARSAAGAEDGGTVVVEGRRGRRGGTACGERRRSIDGEGRSPG
mmetsp:Transcript_21245/g.42320  ORF Transcript_21245/g.42320 Transcript_21245/m.42320 type:complete len:205 (+) Transcript_21245:932-1546(+)